MAWRWIRWRDSFCGRRGWIIDMGRGMGWGLIWLVPFSFFCTGGFRWSGMELMGSGEECS